MDNITWADFDEAYTRMQALRLLEVKARPGTVPGHMLTLAIFGKGQKRVGEWKGGAVLLDWYAEYKQIDPAALRRAIESYWVDCGYLAISAERIIEKLMEVYRS